jgi:hypothetical protein
MIVTGGEFSKFAAAATLRRRAAKKIGDGLIPYANFVPLHKKAPAGS